MNDRFEAVESPQSDNYDWLIGKPKRGKTTVVQDWLQGGYGILPIVGKPGAGKSTLVKHLFCSEQADRRLNEWGTRDGKTLVKGRFFC
ncbi:uncharacterized protein BDV14DRAFT_186145 [Aspergillus stella-maris]|uniref:uncharacterized protein n=1 Tax=Aspergillus stella-maris TaxID=1810926 RepID=UPI003CCD2915